LGSPVSELQTFIGAGEEVDDVICDPSLGECDPVFWEMANLEKFRRGSRCNRSRVMT
jgi:hypothetical protein